MPDREEYVSDLCHYFLFVALFCITYTALQDFYGESVKACTVPAETAPFVENMLL